MTTAQAAADPAIAAEQPGPEDAALGRLIVDDAVARYCAARRDKIASFVDDNFSLIGALRLHKHAVGWDVLRAPANLTLSAPHLAAQVGAVFARRARMGPTADWLEARRFFLQTNVARELEWRLYTELLELPVSQDERSAGSDALADEILRDPRIEAGNTIAPRSPAEREAFRRWLAGSAGTYESTRVSAADLTNALISAGAGALAFKKLTPGMMSLGPAAAQALVQKSAIAGFPLGSGAGALWYGFFPAAASAALSIGLTGGIMAAGAMLSAFSGVATDPIQRRLGLHQRRLRRLIDCLERELAGHGESRFVVRDHYVARTVDLVEALGLAWRAVR